MSNFIADVQSLLKKAGWHTGDVDGIDGKDTQAALTAVVQAANVSVKEGLVTLPTQAATVTKPAYDLIWSAKVTPAFCTRVRKMALDLKLGDDGANQLMACMAFESGETFSPSIQNRGGAHYYGIIQFGDAAAKDCGTTVQALVKMSALEQLEYVYAFFKPYTGRLHTLSDIYMRILWPKVIGLAENTELWDEQHNPVTYKANGGLDANKDKVITKAEAASAVQAKYERGLAPAFRRTLA